MYKYFEYYPHNHQYKRKIIMYNFSENLVEELQHWLEIYSQKCWEYQPIQNVAWEEVGAMDTTNICSLMAVAHLLKAMAIKAEEGGFDVDPLPVIILFLINLKINTI